MPWFADLIQTKNRQGGAGPALAPIIALAVGRLCILVAASGIVTTSVDVSVSPLLHLSCV